jgi:coproporphyrinogen III oxidase-like Fe-S oxidoreductase
MIDEYVINNDEYVGIGSGAFSFLNGVLYANSFSLKEYAEKVGRGQSSISKSTRFGSMSIKKYRMMIEMFGFNGWPKNRPFIEYNALKLLGAVKGKGENAEVTPRGKFLLSVMMKCFYNGMDYIREEMRKDLKTDDERII